MVYYIGDIQKTLLSALGLQTGTVTEYALRSKERSSVSPVPSHTVYAYRVSPGILHM